LTDPITLLTCKTQNSSSKAKIVNEKFCSNLNENYSGKLSQTNFKTKLNNKDLETKDFKNNKTSSSTIKGNYSISSNSNNSKIKKNSTSENIISSISRISNTTVNSSNKHNDQYNQFGIKLEEVRNLNHHLRFLSEDNIRKMNDM